MKEFELKEAAKLFPKGTVNQLSFRCKVSQSTVSKILKGERNKGTDIIRKEVRIILKEVQRNIKILLGDE